MPSYSYFRPFDQAVLSSRPSSLHRIPILARRVSFCDYCVVPACCADSLYNECFRMKALLFALLRAFEFELAVPREDIMTVYAQMVTKPMVVTADKEKQTQLPLIVKPYHAG